MTSFIRDFGPEIAAHYPVCAITPGKKRPMGCAWQDNPLSPDDCRGFPTEDAGVGIILGKGEHPCYGIDVDVPNDEECAKALRGLVCQCLGVTEDDILYRVGMAPKFLVPVCGEEALWRKMTTPWFEKDGVKGRIEILGLGQQFVALAIHPDTQQPYEWHGMPLEGTYIDPPEYLPKASRRALTDIVSGATSIFLSHGWALADGRIAVSPAPSSDAPAAAPTVVLSDPAADELVPQYRLGASIEEAEKWLEDTPGKDDYQTWVNVGMALHHEFANSEFADDAVSVWDKWSQGGKDYKGIGEIRYKWSSFGKHPGLCKTARWLKREYEQRHYNFAGELTEEGRVARFAQYYGGSLKYAIDAGRWYRWDGLVWSPLVQCEVDALAREILGPLLRDDINAMAAASTDDKEIIRMWKFYATMQQSSKAKAIAKGAEKCGDLWCRVGDFNSDSRYFGVRNGVVDLETCEFKTAEKSMMVSIQSGTEYDASATCPTWEQTVSEIFYDDSSMVDYVQRLFGYAMLGKPTEEVMSIFHGNGCNGKSTLMHVMTDLFGGYAHSASPEMLAGASAAKGSAGGARADVVALQHKRLVVMSELDMKAKMHESALKSIVSHDEISARGLYEAEIRTFRPTWVVTMLTNYMPRVDGADDGLWRRIHAVPFDRDFDKDKTIKKDIHRAEKLRGEFPGILNWLLEGVKKYRERGLSQPEKVKKESAEYKQSMDIVGEWLEDRCVVEPGERVPSSLAYNSWEIYSRANGVDYAIKSRTDLTKVLKKRGIVCKSARYEGKIQRCYFGFKLGEQSLEGA